MNTPMAAVAVIALLPFVLVPGGARGGNDLAGLRRCEGKPPQPAADWVRQEQREGFTLRLPACFKEATDGPRFVHGGQRWSCGDVTAEVVWGMWGLDSFDDRDKCRTEVAGIPVMVARRSGEGASVLVWYLTGTVHEPIVSASSDKRSDLEQVEAIAHSGEARAPGR